MKIGWKKAVHICGEWAKDFDSAPNFTSDPLFNAEEADYYRELAKVIAHRKWTTDDQIFASYAMMMTKDRLKNDAFSALLVPELIEESRQLHEFLSDKVGVGDLLVIGPDGQPHGGLR